MAGTYSNPGWINETSPAINASNLNDLSDAAVQNQTDIGALQTLTANYSTVASNASQVPTLAAKIKTATNVAVPSTAWSADGTYSASGYNYKATATVSGVTSSYVPFVNFAMADAVSGNFAPMAVCVTGGVTIYAKAAPNGNTTIGSIVCIGT